MDPRTRGLLEDYAAFFKEFADVDRIDYGPFWLWFSGFRHPDLKPESLAIYRELLRGIEEPVDPAIESGILERLVSTSTAGVLTDLLTRWSAGEEVDLYSGIRDVVQYHESQTQRKVKVPWVNDDIVDLLAADANDVGFHWRLDSLNKSMRPARGGDFIILAGRPDKGKTTALASELTYMAAQVETLYPGQGRDIKWFNNEGPGKRIVQRLHNSALNATTSELVEFSQAGSIRERYARAVGHGKMIRVLDVHDFWSHEIEEILRDTPTAIVVLDMIDNIKFGGTIANGGQRTDQALEAMYQWGRNLAVKYDCVVIATSQISADGDGECFPTLPMLKDSKTGKQGAADAIITLGASNDATLQNTRFIGMTKNKLHKEGGPKDPRREVQFDAQRGRLREPETH